MKFNINIFSVVKNNWRLVISWYESAANVISKAINVLPARNWFYIVIGVIANTIILYNLSFFLINHVVFYADDSAEVVQVSSLIDTLLFERHSPPDKNSIILINSSYDNILVDHYDELTGSGNRTITDRKKLLTLFKALNKEKINYKYILCDIAFIDKTPFDEALAKEMEKMKIVIPSVFDENENILYPNDSFENVNIGVSEYESSEGLFVKFKYAYEHNKSIPVKMYEDIHEKKFTFNNGVYQRDAITVLNNSVLNFRLNHYDVFIDKKYHIMNLGNLLQLPTAVIDKYLSNKIIVIGDFVSNDMHETVVGEMSGPLILLNAYYALVQGDNIVTWRFRLFLLASFFILSFVILLPPQVISRIIFFKRKEAVDKFIKEKFITIIFALLFISICAYMFFGVHVNILYLFFYMVIVQVGIRFIYVYTSHKS